MVFCKYCGQENSENMKFCKNCGAKLETGRTVAPPGPPSSAGDSTCPRCGKPVQPGMKFCRNCGCKLETDPAGQQLPGAAGRICPYCGKPIPSRAKFCKYCSARLSDPENTGRPETVPAAAQEPSAAAFVPEAAPAQDPVSGEQSPVTEQKPVSPEKQKRKTLLLVIGVLGLLIVILTILSAVLIPAKIRELQSASTPFDAEEWLEEDEDSYPPDDRPDQWAYHGGHDLPKWYYDQEG